MIEMARAIVRPALALGAMGGTLLFLLLGVSIPDAWWGTLSTIITFYFVYRHEEKKNGGTP